MGEENAKELAVEQLDHSEALEASEATPQAMTRHCTLIIVIFTPLKGNALRIKFYGNTSLQVAVKLNLSLSISFLNI